MGMKNDTSFLISDILSVYEHQSSFNPNMPLRMLQYVGDLYAGYLSENKINKYGSTLIKLPIPKLVVFYNGRKDIDDEVILRLSDSFEEQLKHLSDIEISVKMLNINYGRNEELMKSCKPLSEYAWFINEINARLKLEHNIKKSVNMAIEAMPDDF